MFVVTEGECFVQKDGISKLEAKYNKGGFFGEGCLKAPLRSRANDPERPLRKPPRYRWHLGCILAIWVAFF